LLAIPGMDHELANKIIGERLQHGRFESTFDLHLRVGVSRAVFQRITGMPYSAQKKHRVAKLAAKLGLPLSSICDLNAIAEAVGKTKGISGCVICDKEGLIVAEHSVGQAAEALSAIASDLILQASRNMAMVGLNTMSSISISIEGQMFTIAKSGELYLTVVHDSNRITGSKLKLIHLTALEMEWAFSRRVFAG
jgi:predicted regulator of Ras-like GTPase activity (Roadblock/LC7/MglB family)